MMMMMVMMIMMMMMMIPATNLLRDRAAADLIEGE